MNQVIVLTWLGEAAGKFNNKTDIVPTKSHQG